ncbi:MAG: hypothetical protein WCL57_17500, partial [Chloroflexota bacterium]
DKFELPLFGIIIISLILILWTAWFIWAKVDVNETSTSVQLTRDGSITATFDPEVFKKIRTGQTVIVYSTDNQQTWEGEVVEVSNRDANRLEPNTVRIYPEKTLQSVELDRVTIKTGTISPLQYTLRLTN